MKPFAQALPHCHEHTLSEGVVEGGTTSTAVFGFFVLSTSLDIV